jgi:DNA topoisomerase-1
VIAGWPDPGAPSPPPTDVWICLDPDGHLQATGRDARGRKQYRYHPRWRSRRDDSKFERILAFAKLLPRIRRRCDRDLARRALSREKVLAAVVRLLELTLIRVGNDEYARLNRSFGLTTMRDRHVTVRGSSVRFRFRGKSGRRTRLISGIDASPTSSVAAGNCRGRSCSSISMGTAGRATSRQTASTPTSGRARTDVTTRDFGSGRDRLAYRALCDLEPANTPQAARRNLLEAVRVSADGLGNTTVARRSYIHFAVLDGYLAGELAFPGLDAYRGTQCRPTRRSSRDSSGSWSSASRWMCAHRDLTNKR